MRYFSDGLVLGSRAFVEEAFESRREWFGERAEARSARITAGEWWSVLPGRFEEGDAELSEGGMPRQSGDGASEHLIAVNISIYFPDRPFPGQRSGWIFVISSTSLDASASSAMPPKAAAWPECSR